MNYDEMIMKYGIISRKRFTKKQKFFFLNGLKQDLDLLQKESCLVESKLKGEAAYNLYVGDITRASTIIWTYFDTPNKSFLLYKYVIGKLPSLILRLLAVFLPNLIIFLTGSAFYLLVAQPVLSDGVFQFIDILVYLVYAVLILLMIKFRHGMANGLNLNRNMSGILALLDLIADCQDKKVTFAFVDYDCVNGYGEQMLRSYAKMANQYIKLECVGSHSPLYLLQSDEGIHEAKKLLARKDYIVCRAEKKKQGYVVTQTDTAKDKEVSAEKIQEAVAFMKQLLINK